jgi:hypothetical protein
MALAPAMTMPSVCLTTTTSEGRPPGAFFAHQRWEEFFPKGRRVAISPTPLPTPDGVKFLTPEILREGDPRRSGTASRT